MNALEVLHIVAVILLAVASAQLPSAAFAFFEGTSAAWLGSIAITAAAGAIMWYLTPRRVDINAREGVAVVGLGWIAVVLAGSLPFLLTGTAPTVAAALFESTSGFTTTGATVFPRVEDLPRSILLWRSVSHWLGGMGIIVLGVAILPMLGVGGAQLFQAEAPGISTDKVQPRITTTARALWAVYAILTAALTLGYLVLGMSGFDAVNHAMSTLATGGFSTRTASLAAFSGAIQWLTVIFMLLAGTNFTLHYRMLLRNRRAWIADYEWRWYAGLALVASSATIVVLAVTGDGWGGDIVNRAVFNVVAVLTTTGFATDDFATWPATAQVILIGLMFVGAMGGSTGGGFKIVRAAVVAKHVGGTLQRVLHPKGVFVTRLGRQAIKSDIVLNVLAFLALYIVTHAVGTLVLTALGHDILTATSAALAAMSSIGPGLGDVGPASHYGDMNGAAHLTLAVLMLLGRLEFYTLLVLLVPGAWRRAGGDRVLR